MEQIDDITLLKGLVHQIIARNFVLKTALVGTWKALIEKGIMSAGDLDEEIDIILAHYPSDRQDDPGALLLQELKGGLYSPFAEYAEKVFPGRGTSNDPVN